MTKRTAFLLIFLGCGGDDGGVVDPSSSSGDVSSTSSSSSSTTSDESTSTTDASSSSEASTTTGERDDCDEVQAELDAAASAYLEEVGLVGLSVSVKTRGCPEWNTAWGLADVDDDTPLTTEHLLRTGSITKTFTAALMLRLNDEHEIGLDQTLEYWQIDVPASDEITLRRLLDHTSGIADYQNNPDFIAALQADPARVWEPQELVDYAVALEPTNEPGLAHAYSNTGYVLIGMVVEATTGQTWAEAMRQRVLDPLQLEHAFVEGDEQWGDPTATGYLVVETGAPQDTTGLYHPSQVWAAGAVVASGDDVRTFMAALMGTEWLSESSQEALTQFSPASGTEYGLGIYAVSLDGVALYGHNGAVQGFQGATFYEPQKATTVVVMHNQLNVTIDGELAGDPTELAAELVLIP